MERSAHPWANLHCDGPDCVLILRDADPAGWMEVAFDDQQTRHFCSASCALAFVEAYESARESFIEVDAERKWPSFKYGAHPPTVESARDR